MNRKVKHFVLFYKFYKFHEGLKKKKHLPTECEVFMFTIF